MGENGARVSRLNKQPLPIHAKCSMLVKWEGAEVHSERMQYQGEEGHAALKVQLCVIWYEEGSEFGSWVEKIWVVVIVISLLRCVTAAVQQKAIMGAIVKRDVMQYK